MIMPTAAPSRQRAGIAVAIFAVLAFYGTLAKGRGFLYDDRELILNEPQPGGIGDFARAFVVPYYGALPYYRPLSRVTYLAQKGAFGDTPLPFLLANAALAALTVGAAYGLLTRPRFGVAPVPALIAAVLFCVHPVASSCVLPIAGRDTLLPVFLMIAAVTLWLRPGRLARAGAIAAFGLALLTKELAIATPLLFLLADATAPDRPKGLPSWARRHAPWAAVALVYAGVRHEVLRGSAVTLTSGGSLLLPVASLGYGLQSTFAPYFGLVYEPALAAWLSPLRLSIAVVAIGALVALAHRSKNAAFWLGWFVAMQLPAANLVRQETLFDERYVFPALLGPLALVAMWATRHHTNPRRRIRIGAAAVAIVVTAIAFTVNRAAAFTSEAAFHEAWVRTSPASADAQNGLGVVRLAQGRTDEAEAAFRAALALRPDHPEALNNLGVLLLDRGDVGEATSQLEAAVAASPRYATARYNLGNARAAQGRTSEAEALYREALELHPGYVQAWNNLGALLVRERRPSEALEAFDAVVRLDPRHAKAYVNRGILLAHAGRYAEAIVSYRSAIAVAPDDPNAHFDLAGALAETGDVGGAVAEYERALALRPGWSEALRDLEILGRRR
jgi:tetratricopeptide (TPR) repeat protein